MTHEEEMKKLRAETAYWQTENDKLIAKINQQLKDINKDINDSIKNLRGY